MQPLTGKQLDFLIQLRHLKTPDWNFLVGDIISAERDMDEWINFVCGMEKDGLIEVTECYVNYSNGPLDTFLKSFADAVNNKDMKSAKILANSGQMPSLVKTVKKYTSFCTLMDVFSQVFSERDGGFSLEPYDTDFGKDLIESTNISLKKNKKLDNYFEKYLTLFRTNKLSFADDEQFSINRKKKDDTKYRFETQRSLILSYFNEQLTTKKPSSLNLMLHEWDQGEHISPILLLESLLLEGVVETYTHTSGQSWHVSVDEQKLLDSLSQKTKLKLSYDPKNRILTVINSDGHVDRKKFQGAVQQDVLNYILSDCRSEDGTFNSWDLAERIGRNIKSVRNAIYQLGIRFENEFPDALELFDQNTDYFHLNHEIAKFKDN
jgi:hypothetical protein